MNKSEAKFHNTSLKMNNALFTLLETKDFLDISITDICKAAGVNRSTFYAHYDNLLDLLLETERQLMSDFFKKFNSDIKMSDIKNLSQEDSVFITAEYILPYLEFVKENKKIFSVYMKHIVDFKPEEIFGALLDNVFIPVLSKYDITDGTLVSYFAKYYLTGINAITMNWLERDCVDDINLICEIILMCVRPNMH